MAVRGDCVPDSLTNETNETGHARKEEIGQTNYSALIGQALKVDKIEPAGDYCVAHKVDHDSDTGDEDGDNDQQIDHEDILQNGCLLKQVTSKGGGKRPELHDKVKVSMISEMPEHKKAFPEEIFEFILGDGDVVQALELAVGLMDIGEEAKIISGYKYMYGRIGLSPDVPPYANFKLKVKLISSQPWDYKNLDFQKTLAEAKAKRDRGNFLYKRKEFDRAVHSYSLANMIVDPSLCVFSEDQPQEILEDILEFRATVLGNSSIALFKLGCYQEALTTAEAVVELRPKYVKGHWRMGQAQEKLGLIEEAIKSYKHALTVSENNPPWIEAEVTRLTEQLDVKKEAKKEMYQKLFAEQPSNAAKPKSTVTSPAIIPKHRAKISTNKLTLLAKVLGYLSLAAVTGFILYRYSPKPAAITYKILSKF